MKLYIKSAQNKPKNFTGPSSLSEGMLVRDADEDFVRTVKSSIKKGRDYEVTFDNGDCFMYDSNDRFEIVQER